METTELKKEVPFVSSFRDYHDIEFLEEDINKVISGRKIKSYEITNIAEEIAGDFVGYWGLFYVGRRPKKSVIKELLRKELSCL